MMPKRKVAILAAAGLVLVTSAAGVAYKLNGSADTGSAGTMAVDSIAANDPEASGASDLYIPVEGDVVIQDTLVLAVSAAGLPSARRVSSAACAASTHLSASASCEAWAVVKVMAWLPSL